MERATHILGTFALRRSTDEDLFARAIGGDAAAFSEVYRRYEKRVYAFCLARSLDREAAADATQEVFVRLLKAAPGSVDHPRAWLFTVARNISTDALRKRIRLRESGEVDEDAPAWESMAAGDTADAVTARADAQAVFLALRRLNPRYRTALILREIHGQSSADIAEAMGVASTGAVDTLVSRARDAFGVAYAAIPELPQACRQSIELMYRSRGTGVSPQESDALKAHLTSCERCRREDARADDPKRFPALLPLMVPAGAAAHSLLGRAALASGNLPGAPLSQQISQFIQAHLHTVGSRVAVGVLAATLVAAPVVAVNVAHRAPRPSLARASAARTYRAPDDQATREHLVGRAVMAPGHAVESSMSVAHTGPMPQALYPGAMPARVGMSSPTATPGHMVGGAAAPGGSPGTHMSPGAGGSTAPAAMPAAGAGTRAGAGAPVGAMRGHGGSGM